MAIGNTPTYSEWLAQNPDLMGGGTQTNQAPPVTAQYEMLPPPQQQPQQQPAQQPRQQQEPANTVAKAANIAQAIASRGPQVQPQYGLQGNLYQSGSKVQSDAPSVRPYQGMNPHYMRNKVGQIVAAVMSYGASTTTKGDGSLNQQGYSQSPASTSNTSASVPQTDLKLYGE